MKYKNFKIVEMKNEKIKDNNFYYGNYPFIVLNPDEEFEFECDSIKECKENIDTYYM